MKVKELLAYLAQGLQDDADFNLDTQVLIEDQNVMHTKKPKKISYVSFEAISATETAILISHK